MYSMSKYLVIFPFLFLLFFSCKRNERQIYFCDVEQVDESQDVFISEQGIFSTTGGRSSEEAYEGKYSYLADKDNPNGMILTIDDFKANEIFKISVYRKGVNNGGTVIISSLDGKFNLSQNISYVGKDKNGWEKLELTAQLPHYVDTLKTLRVYVFNNSKTEKTYFDNLRVERYLPKHRKQLKYKNLNSVQIEIDKEDYKTLLRYRDVALVKGIISEDLKKEFKGELSYNGETYKIGIRLKGDWTDHLTGEKWSFRIKIKKDKAFMGLKSFSIQAPTARGFLNEWIAHEICRKEDLLATRYFFAPVAVNGVHLGIYNFEEHFEKQLLESKKRREGPIVKFSEEGFWETAIYRRYYGNSGDKPVINASVILPFKKKKTLKTEKLKNQFLIAQNLMMRYKEGSFDMQSYLDIEKMAKMYALYDLCNIEHSITWHNQRLYYNPITSVLEPIVFDCYANPVDHKTRPIVIRGSQKIDSIFYKGQFITTNVFNNHRFMKHYVKYLKHFSSESYMKQFLSELNSEIDSLNTMLNMDYTYFYDKSFLIENAKQIRSQIPLFEKKIEEGITSKLYKIPLTNCVTALPFNHFSLQTHVEGVKSNGTALISMKNYHCKPIEVIGYITGKKKKKKKEYFSKSIIMQAYSPQQLDHTMMVNKIPEKMIFKVVDDVSQERELESNIIKWKRPTTVLSYASKVNIPLDSNSPIYEIKDSVIEFKEGIHKVERSIVIPLDYKVVFNAGTELIFNKKTFFLSYSPVFMNGEAGKPIKITSEDKTANGFTVLQASQKSKLTHAIFDGMNTLDMEGWTLTGAVTFAESDVDITHCIFSNNSCEDGLNIVNSVFSMKNSTVSHTFSDGFDADFCEGIVQNSKFIHTGNDGVDFSGSKITIIDCEMKNVGDKGISCGEESFVSITNTIVSNAIIGVASKDKSKVIIDRFTLDSCKLGFQLFQKKPEYGPAYIEVSNYTKGNIKQEFECEKNSIFKKK